MTKALSKIGFDMESDSDPDNPNAQEDEHSRDLNENVTQGDEVVAGFSTTQWNLPLRGPKRKISLTIPS